MATGELYTDENGYVNSTLQYKTSYYDRDSSITLTAVPNTGYRLEGWYLSKFDSTYGWVVSDKTIAEELNATYSDEIVKTEFINNSNVTTYTLSSSGYYPYKVNGSREFKRTYSISSAESTRAIFSNDYTAVPESVRSSYIALFANIGVSRTTPKFVQIYMKNNSKSELYYDKEYTRKVKLTDFNVTYSSFIELWNNNYIGYMNIYDAVTIDYGTTLNNANFKFDENANGTFTPPSSIKYTLNGNTVYAVYTYNDKNASYDIKYYLTKDNDNVLITGNSVTISTLHANMRLVAKFVEVYESKVFNEAEEDSGISVEALYYYNEDNDKGVIRTNSNGDPVYGDMPLTGTSVEKNYLGGNIEGDDYLFAVNEVEEGGNAVSLLNRINADNDENTHIATEQTYLEKYYTADSIKNFERLSALKNA